MPLGLAAFSQVPMLNPYLQLLRLRTLPLAVTAMLCASALAYHHHHASAGVLFWSLLTAVCLQIVSNIANDYGDGLRGTDSQRDAHAPPRVTASGRLSVRSVRLCLYGACLAAMASGLWLLLGVAQLSMVDLIGLLLLGALSIAAALAYTLGRYAYGYRALGEVAVLVFFGWLAVIGSFYLHAGQWHPALLWPATGCGLLAAAVLHTNNQRDLFSDRVAGKRTLAGLCGFQGSKWLQLGGLLAGLACYLVYAIHYAYAALVCVLVLPILLRHLHRLWLARTPAEVGRELPVVVGLHSATNILFAVGLVLTRWWA